MKSERDTKTNSSNVEGKLYCQNYYDRVFYRHCFYTLTRIGLLTKWV